MKSYTLSKFIKLAKKADIIYGSVSLNASVRVPSRIKKKSLLKALLNIEDGMPLTTTIYFGSFEEDSKGRKILKVM